MGKEDHFGKYNRSPHHKIDLQSTMILACKLFCFGKTRAMTLHTALLALLTAMLFSFCSPASAQMYNTTTDSTVHYYVNGAISVIRTPWTEGRRETKFYDLNGELTYTIEEARMSYSVSASLKFYKNGGVEEAGIFTNPGASRYMYESTIYFSSTNEPIRKASRQVPADSIEAAMGDNYFWNKKEKRWIKQEIAICDPPRE